MTVNLVALDLDGTVFSDDLVISTRLRSAIGDVQAAGIPLTIATGRMFVSARQIARELNIAQPLICYQGAMVAHSTSGEIIYHRTVPDKLSRAIIRETQTSNLHLNLYLGDKIYVSKITPEAEFYSRINMDMPLHEVGDLEQWLDAQGGAEPTKLVIITNPEETDAILARFTSEYGDLLQVTKSHPRFTEFTNAECSKGRALAYLAEQMGVARETVMAIGDGHNDFDMIQWAGYGVAMASSPREVLDVARVVALSLAEDGAARVIEEYVLSRPV